MSEEQLNNHIAESFRKAQEKIRLEAIESIFDAYKVMVKLKVEHYINMTSRDNFYADEFDRLMTMDIEALHNEVERLDCECGRAMVAINDYYNQPDSKENPQFPFK